MEVHGVDHPVGRLNGQRLDAGEKRGAVIEARPNVEELIGYALNKQTGLSASRPWFPNPSAIQQARIESKLDRLADLDFFEIGMLGI